MHERHIEICDCHERDFLNVNSTLLLRVIFLLYMCVIIVSNDFVNFRVHIHAHNEASTRTTSPADLPPVTPTTAMPSIFTIFFLRSDLIDFAFCRPSNTDDCAFSNSDRYSLLLGFW